MREWREFSRPITVRSKAKPIQSRITFDTQLKIALSRFIVIFLGKCLSLFGLLHFEISLTKKTIVWKVNSALSNWKTSCSALKKVDLTEKSSLQEDL